MNVQSISVVTGALLCVFGLHAQETILDARTNYNLGQIVSVEGVVTSDENLGTVRYIQDETAGIVIYPGSNWNAWQATPEPGDLIAVTGVLTEYNGLLEVGPELFDVSFLGSAEVPPPLLVTPEQLNESVEAQLVEIEAVAFSEAGGTFEGNSTYDFVSAGESGVIYVRNSNSLVGSLIPGCASMIGLVSQFTFDGTGGYQLLPRGTNDLTPGLCPSDVELTDLTTSGFSLSWTMDVPCDCTVEYGLTEEFGFTSFSESSSTNHAVSLTSLSPGTIYYVQISCSTADGLVGVTNTQAYATVSESSGAIHTLFNRSQLSPSENEPPAILPADNLVDSLIAWIGLAQHTLDVASYNFNSPAIAEAINQAKADGVAIRWLYEGQNANLSLAALDDGIPTFGRADGQGAGMHNSFVVGDAEYSDAAFVFTGSGHFTDQSLMDDANNALVIEDQSLARAYTLEFEEMWGSSTATPNSNFSAFGATKDRNTPTQFLIGGNEVELYFSPSDGTTHAIETAILSAQESVEFAQLAFTRNDLGEAVLAAHMTVGVDAIGLIDQVNTAGSEFQFLSDNGVSVYPGPSAETVMHKYAILDHGDGVSGSVISGSHNWTSTSETVNDENTLIIHNGSVAEAYHQEFLALGDDFFGCTDIEACNFDPSAEIDDASCYYPNICGSCDPAADEAECGGCTSEDAVNFDESAVYDDGSCSFVDFTCSGIGLAFWDDLELGFYADSGFNHILGIEAVQEFVLNMPSTVVDPLTGTTYAIETWSNLEFSGMPQGLSVDLGTESTFLPNNQYCMSYQGVPLELGAFDVHVSGEMTISLFGNALELDTFEATFSITVAENPDDIIGCTYPTAVNYMPIATDDSGDCQFAGCTDLSASNFNLLATIDDDSCEYGPGEALCPADVDGDGTVTVSDLLGLLAAFGEDCDPE